MVELRRATRRRLIWVGSAGALCLLAGAASLWSLWSDGVLWYPALELGWGLCALGLLVVVTSLVLWVRER